MCYDRTHTRMHESFNGSRKSRFSKKKNRKSNTHKRILTRDTVKQCRHSRTHTHTHSHTHTIKRTHNNNTVCIRCNTECKSRQSLIFFPCVLLWRHPQFLSPRKKPWGGGCIQSDFRPGSLSSKSVVLNLFRRSAPLSSK